MVKRVEYGNDGYMGAGYKKDERVEVAGEIEHETDKAYRFYDGSKAEWLPKSQVEWDGNEKIMTMPEWLAKTKGFI